MTFDDFREHAHSRRGWNNVQFAQLFAITCNYPQSRLRLDHFSALSSGFVVAVVYGDWI